VFSKVTGGELDKKKWKRKRGREERVIRTDTTIEDLPNSH